VATTSCPVCKTDVSGAEYCPKCGRPTALHRRSPWESAKTWLVLMVVFVVMWAIVGWLL